MKRPSTVPAPTIALIASVLAMSVARAQRPVPPVTPVAPVAPVSPVMPVAPVMPVMPVMPVYPSTWDYGVDYDLQATIASAKAAVDAAAWSMPDIDDMKAAMADARAATWDTQAQMDEARVALDAARPALAALKGGYAFGGSSSFGGLVAARSFANAGPPAPWAQGDPADSLYRIAWNTINQGDYRRAADLFASLAQKYPRSEYAASAPYWQAFALYRIGSTEDLRAAAKQLEGVMAHQGEMPRRQMSNMDVPGLYARINGVLASRGDRDAAAKVSQEAQQAGHPTCDNEDLSVRVEALNALARTDPSSAVPLLRRVLESHGECTTELRRNAVFILGQRADTSAGALLASVAKSDPDVRVREAAIEWLPRVPNPPISTLESLMTSDTSGTIQRAAARALMSSDDPRARQSIRTIIDKPDVNEKIRLAAIGSYTSDHGTADDAAFLRGAYSRAQSDRVKSAIVYAVSRMGGADNEQWLLGLARNPAESSSIRASALEQLGRTTMSVTDLASLYDAADSRTMRYQIINILSDRKEPAATDKLLDIARSGTDPVIRTRAIDALTRKNDPRTTKLLLDIIDHSAASDEKKP